MHGGLRPGEGDNVTVLAPGGRAWQQDIDVERARRALEAAGQRWPSWADRSGTGRRRRGGQADRALGEAEDAQHRAEVRLEVAGATDGRGACPARRRRAGTPNAVAGRRGPRRPGSSSSSIMAS